MLGNGPGQGMLRPVERPSKRVIVAPYDPAWHVAFEAEAERVVGALGDLVSALHHIGSTSIPGLCAKPIIDMLLVTGDGERLDRASAALVGLGYEARGEHGIAGRRYLHKSDAAGVRTHHVHAFASDSPHVGRHLAFRDYMIAHPAEAERYGALKQRLAREYRYDIDGYVAGKAPYIEQQLARALAWWSGPRER